MAALSFAESDILNAKKEIFSVTSGSGWIILGYSGNTIVLQHRGNGGVDEMVSHLVDDQIQYCLIRLPDIEKDVSKIDRRDGKIATKDIFITWQGPSVRQVERGKKTGHLGNVSKLLQPYHAELTAINKANFTEAVVRERAAPLSVTSEIPAPFKRTGHEKEVLSASYFAMTLNKMQVCVLVADSKEGLLSAVDLLSHKPGSLGSHSEFSVVTLLCPDEETPQFQNDLKKIERENRVLTLYDDTKLRFPSDDQYDAKLKPVFEHIAIPFVSSYVPQCWDRINQKILKATSNETIRTNLFLSHRQRTGQGIALPLYQILKEKFKVFLDIKSDFDLHNLRIIVSNTDVFAFIVTEGIFDSIYCLTEFETAVQHNKPIIVITTPFYEIPKQLPGGWSKFQTLFFALPTLSYSAHYIEHVAEQLSQKVYTEINSIVRYGDKIKIQHGTGKYLQSLGQRYHTGSGQHAIVGVSDINEATWWTVGPGHQGTEKKGDIIYYGQVIQLIDEEGQKLHSHVGHYSPSSGQQEITSYGGNDGNDDWIVRRFEKNKGGWKWKEHIRLVHGPTRAAAHSHSNTFVLNGVEYQEITCCAARDENDKMVVAEIQKLSQPKLYDI